MLRIEKILIFTETTIELELSTILNKTYPLSEKSLNELENLAETIELPKGYQLIRAGKLEPNIYLIINGIARAYSFLDDTEITFWFGIEGDFIFSMRSYIENKPSYENIELLEDCKLYLIPIKCLQKLYLKNIEIANWGRKYVEHEIIKTETRLIARQFRTASERYQELVTSYPMLLQRVSLGIIASYLGITQVTLSRIRAEK